MEPLFREITGSKCGSYLYGINFSISSMPKGTHYGYAQMLYKNVSAHNHLIFMHVTEFPIWNRNQFRRRGIQTKKIVQQFFTQKAEHFKESAKKFLLRSFYKLVNFVEWALLNDIVNDRDRAIMIWWDRGRLMVTTHRATIHSLIGPTFYPFHFLWENIT